jgi:hypothetical protein
MMAGPHACSATTTVGRSGQARNQSCQINRLLAFQAQEQHDDLDCILSDEQEILPSSGFAASVMESVRQEASAPPPIPFPWKRALPGLVASCLLLVALVCLVHAQLQQGAAASLPSSAWVSIFSGTIEASMRHGAHWILAALFLAVAPVKFAMRLASAGD